MVTFPTPEQVAERFQVTAKTVRDWLRSGEPIGVKVGRSRRIRARDIDRYLDDQRLVVLVERARRANPLENRISGQCQIRGETLPVPNYIGMRVCGAG